MIFYHDGVQDLVLMIEEVLIPGLPMPYIELDDTHHIVKKLKELDEIDVSLVKIDLETNELILTNNTELVLENSIVWTNNKEFSKTPISTIEDNGPHYDFLIEHIKTTKTVTARIPKPLNCEVVVYVAENNNRDNLLGTIIISAGKTEASLKYKIDGNIVVMSEKFYNSGYFYEIS